MFSPGTLYLTSSLTRLGAASISLSIAAQDGGGLSSVRPAEVIVEALTSVHAPAVFQTSCYTFTVPEDAQPGTGVGTVRAANPLGRFARPPEFIHLGRIKDDVVFTPAHFVNVQDNGEALM